MPNIIRIRIRSKKQYLLTSARNECYKGKTSPNGDSLTSDERKALPIIDLFLNPRREAEKEDVLEMARKEEAGLNHTKVKNPFNIIFA